MPLFAVAHCLVFHRRMFVEWMKDFRSCSSATNKLCVLESLVTAWSPSFFISKMEVVEKNKEEELDYNVPFCCHKLMFPTKLK